MGSGIKFKISRQISLFIVLTLALLMATFVFLIWQLAGPRLPIPALWILLGYTVIASVLITLGVTFLVHVFIRKPLEKLTQGLKQAEKGDFLYRVNIGSQNEIGHLAQNFNHMMSRFTDLMATQLDTERELDQTQAELKLKTQLAQQTEVIRQTNEELEDRIKYLSLLYDIGNQISSIIEPSQLYQSLVRIVSEKLGYEEFAILILEPKSEMLEVVASHGYLNEEELKKVKFALGEGISGVVAQSGKRQLIRDTAKDTRYLHYKGQHNKEGSFLCLPLKVKGSVLGVFNFFQPKRNGFSAKEIRLLAAIANQSAIAIENAQLFNDARQLSVTDELTRVANRRYFKNMLELEKKRVDRFGKPLSILMVDVDYFKKYNDTYGHLEGDTALKKIAAVLEHNVRQVDLVARFGGEEFIILLTNIDDQGALNVAESLRQKIEETHFKGEAALPGGKLTISVGCASCPEDTKDIDELENLADIALYEAKRKGKNLVVRYQPPKKKSRSKNKRPASANP